MRARARSLWPFAFVACASVVLAWSRPVRAYPWMIRHDYSGCATCHVDPSGAGVLTEYGRAQSAILLSSRYGAPADEDPGQTPDFLFGIVPASDVLLLQGWFRNGYIWNDSGGRLVDQRLLQMVADLGADVVWQQFRAGGRLGYNGFDTAVDSELAWVTPGSPAGNLVSREHWAGVSLADDAILLRGGRMNVPFGLRNIEHPSWVRSETRTDINQDQQDGLALAYSNSWLRGELLGIAGNYQINPDAYRERGYAVFAEVAGGPGLAAGVSSLLTHAAADILTHEETTRQAHGLFVRTAPWKALVFLGEFDALVTSRAGARTEAGYVAFAQADIEPVQGVHAMVTGETLNRGATGEATSFGEWLGAAWFAVPHVDMRFDAIRRTQLGTPATLTYLLQLQVYL
jgi:hypothetical protein